MEQNIELNLDLKSKFNVEIILYCEKSKHISMIYNTMYVLVYLGPVLEERI